MNESAVTCNQYLLYIDEYEALICRQCECAIAGAKSHVERHFRERHKTVALKDRKKLAQFADGLRVTDPRQLNVPKTLTKPIDGIRLRRGFECEKCELVCVSETIMNEYSYSFRFHPVKSIANFQYDLVFLSPLSKWPGHISISLSHWLLPLLM